MKIEQFIIRRSAFVALGLQCITQLLSVAVIAIKSLKLEMHGKA